MSEERPWHCRRCGAVLGQTTDEALRLPTVTVRYKQEFFCNACGKKRQWAPQHRTAAVH